MVAKCAADGKEYTAAYQSEDGEGSVTVKYLADGEEEEVLVPCLAWPALDRSSRDRRLGPKAPRRGLAPAAAPRVGRRRALDDLARQGHELEHVAAVQDEGDLRLYSILIICSV